MIFLLIPMQRWLSLVLLLSIYVPAYSFTWLPGVATKLYNLAYWPVLWAPSLKELSQARYNEHVATILPTADDATASFVKAVLTESGYPTTMVDDVRIVNYHVFGSTIRAIWIDKEFIEFEKQGFQNAAEGKEKAPIKTNMCFSKALLLHEGGHVYHRHQQKKTIYSILAPFINHYAINKLTRWSNIQNHKGYKYIDLPLKMGLFFAGGFLVRKHSEWQADTEVIQRANDPNILYGMSEFVKAHALILQKKRELSHPGFASLLRLAPFLEEFADVHQASAKRAERFERAAEKLEKNKGI